MHGQHTNVAGKIKICVVGPFQAGKTTLVHSLDSKAVSVERKYKYGSTIISTTVGFDMGRVLWLHGDEDKIIESSKLRKEYLKDKNTEIWEVTLMGTPGQLHFKNVREAIAKGSDGVLFVIDSTKPGQAGYILALLEEIRNFLGDNIPMVLIANKQDLKNALKAERIREILKLDGVKIIEASAIKGEGVMEGLIELLKMIRETRLKK